MGLEWDDVKELDDQALKELHVNSRMHRKKILEAAKDLEDPVVPPEHLAPDTRLKLLTLDGPLRVADFAREVENAHQMIETAERKTHDANMELARLKIQLDSDTQTHMEEGQKAKEQLEEYYTNKVDEMEDELAEKEDELQELQDAHARAERLAAELEDTKKKLEDEKRKHEEDVKSLNDKLRFIQTTLLLMHLE